MIIWSDHHFDNFSEFALPWQHGCNTRLEELLDVLEEVFKIAKKENTQTLLHLGDWFEKWNSIHTSLFSVVTEKLYSLISKYNIDRFIMLPGNHDMNNKRSTDTITLKAYQGHPKITVVTEPTLLDLAGLSSALVPYYQDLNYVVQSFLELNKKGAKYAFGHTDLIGGESSLDGYVATGGISPGTFRNYKHSVFGHYHFPQGWLVGDDHYVEYVGAPCQTRVGDAGQTRGVLSLDEKGSKFIPLNYMAPEIFRITGKETIDTKKGYFCIECPRNELSEYREFYDQLFKDQTHRYKLIPKKDEIKEMKIVLINEEDPISDYVQYNKKENLNKNLLKYIGNMYLKGN